MIPTIGLTLRTLTFVCLRLLSIAILLMVLIGTSSAQTGALDGTTPTALAAGAPAGSYGLSGFDNINLFNGNLNFRLPLVHVGGRGMAGYTMMLPIEQRWRSINGYYEDTGSGSIYYYEYVDSN